MIMKIVLKSVRGTPTQTLRQHLTSGSASGGIAAGRRGLVCNKNEYECESSCSSGAGLLPAAERKPVKLEQDKDEVRSGWVDRARPLRQTSR